MEINIASLLDADLFAFSHSRMEGGQDAGRNTWNAAKAEAGSAPLLQTPEQLQALRDYARGFGAWDAEEIAGWDETECNALFLQLIAGDVREAGWDSLDEAQWTEDGELIARFHDVPEEEWERAECSNIFRTDDGEIFYSLFE
jgi:hypothetical protein